MGRLCLRFKDGKLMNKYFMALLRFLRSVAAPWWSSNNTCLLHNVVYLTFRYQSCFRACPSWYPWGSFMNIERALIL